jgi:endonuclease-3
MLNTAVKSKIKSIDKLLEKMYGIRVQNKFSNPTDELILTVLSQNTNDNNRDKAFKALKDKYPGWKHVANARTSSIARAIKVGGLANIKSKRIKKILKQIGKDSPIYSLNSLKELSDSKAWEYLTGFDGVGPKTASCVMMFSFGRNFMPVDTHVFRVGKRLGIIPGNLNADKSHDLFRKANLNISLYQLHLNMIRHGREKCRPRNPKCDGCILRQKCNYYKETVT